MNTTKTVLIPLFRNDVAPRFDLAAEVLIAEINAEGINTTTLILAHSSADELCDLILARNIDAVICGGIEEEYYHYLRWKRVDTIDSVMGPAEIVLDLYCKGALKSGDILFPREATCAD